MFDPQGAGKIKSEGGSFHCNSSIGKREAGAEAGHISDHKENRAQKMWTGPEVPCMRLTSTHMCTRTGTNTQKSVDFK